MLVLIGVTLLLLAIHTSYINMAVTSTDVTNLDFISELLNPEECHELFIRIAVSQKEAKETLKEKDLFPTSQWQEISSVAQCKEALNHWLEVGRGTVDWDRLAQALQQIGRPDASKVLKNSLNKNKSLKPKWTVEDNDKAETVKLAPVVQNESCDLRWIDSLVEKALPNESSSDLTTLFRLSFRWNKGGIQDFLGPVGHIILVCCLVLCLVSAYYVIYWLLGQCLFPKRVQYSTTPTGQNMNFTMVLNDQPNEDSWEEWESNSNTSEYGESMEDEF